MHCECLRLADRPPGKREEEVFWVFFSFFEEKSWIDGRCGAGANVAVD